MNDELFAQPSIAQRIYESLDEQGYLPRDFPSGNWSILRKSSASSLLTASLKGM